MESRILLKTIMVATGCSAECTFTTYYKNDVKEGTTYGESILIFGSS